MLFRSLYTNPVILVLILLSLIALFRQKIPVDPKIRLLLLSGLPLVVVFLTLSLFRSTLPHWSGPGYMTLLPLAALYLRQREPDSGRVFPKWLTVALAFLLTVILLGIVQVTTGFIRFEPANTAINKKGEKDLSLEVYGWKQLGDQFTRLSERYEKSGEMQAHAPIISWRWFPAANLEYYAARPSGRYVLVSGDLDAAHTYSRINRIHGGFRLNSDAWYITSSRDFRDPLLLIPLYFQQILAPDTIRIDRCGKTAYYFFVYRMKNLQSKPGEGEK